MVDEKTTCGLCGGVMETGMLMGYRSLAWLPAGRPVPRLSVLGLESLDEGIMRPAKISAARCPKCRTGTFSY